MGQGFFESDDDYRARTAKEADEQTIKDASGSAPSQGIFESEFEYISRISKEANENRIQTASGRTPSQGIFEDDGSYRARIEKEANERYLEASSNHTQSQGFFESDDAYSVRVRKEANEQTISAASGQHPKKGFFEREHDYRSRIAHEAREITASGRLGPRHLEAKTYNSSGLSNQSSNGRSASNPWEGQAHPNQSNNRTGILWSFVRLAGWFIVSQLVGVLLVSICFWFKNFVDGWNYGLLELIFLILPIGLLMIAILIVGLIVALPTFILVSTFDLMSISSRYF